MAHTQLQNMLSRRSLRLALNLALVTVAGWALVSNDSFLTRRAQAAGFVVTNTHDSGLGTLRQAILDANNNGKAVVDTITYNISGGGLKPILLASQLPFITTPTTIDGYSQPGASPNTLAVGDNAVLFIELDGNNLGGAGGLLTIVAPDC